MTTFNTGPKQANPINPRNLVYFIFKTPSNNAIPAQQSKRNRYNSIYGDTAKTRKANHSFALGLLLLLFGFFCSTTTSSASLSLCFSAASNSSCPQRPASSRTRVLTDALSLLFFPSRLLTAMVSMNVHSLPLSRILLVAGSRCGRHSGAIWQTSPDLDFRTDRMPSSWKRWKAFLSVSLLTASKYEMSPWW